MKVTIELEAVEFDKFVDSLGKTTKKKHVVKTIRTRKPKAKLSAKPLKEFVKEGLKND